MIGSRNNNSVLEIDIHIYLESERGKECKRKRESKMQYKRLGHICNNSARGERDK